MTNPFYTASGNPANGSEGLSATMRAEFLSIQTAFDVMPRLSTTGLFDTVFNQLGNYTFTLPSVSGTLASTANVATETARAIAAEATLTTAVGAETTRATAAEALLAPKASPTFTGTAIVPAATIGGGTINNTPIGSTTPSTGAFTTLSASSTVSGAGFTAWLASPPAIGGTAAGPGTFTALDATSGNVFNDVGRNLLHNGMLRVHQRGTSGFSANGVYTADRWLIGLNSDFMNVAVVAVSDAARTAIGDEEATSYLSVGCSSAGTAASYSSISQRLESVRRLAGKTVTFSFYGNSSVNGLKVGASITQVFGSGGSTLVASNGTAVTLSTAWVRYSITLVVPTIIGKTVGSGGDDFTELNIWISAGSTQNTRSGSVGVQSATFQLWGMQLEIGDTASQIEKVDRALELANCERFYNTMPISIGGYYGAAGAFTGPGVFFPTMRATPTASAVSPTFGNASAITVGALSAQTVSTILTVSAAGNAFCNCTLNLTADL